MNNKLKLNILIFPGGTENGIEIYNSLKYEKGLKLFSVSNKSLNHASYIYKKHFIIPDISNKKCLVELNKIIRKNNIDYIFPANSFIIDFLSKYRKSIISKLVLPKNNIVEIVRSKKKTYELFKNIIPTPKVFNSIDYIKEYPIFIKPDAEYGSKGTAIVNCFEELNIYKNKFNDYVFSEYLSGEEFTIECFSSIKHGLTYSNARSRSRIRMGTSMHSANASKKIQSLTQKYSKKIFEKLKIEGLWFYQMKFDQNGVLKLLEIETRVAGTMAFSRVLGVNLPLANLFLLENKEFKILKNTYQVKIDRCLKNRYKLDLKFEFVYVDLDDTIIINNKLNLDIIKFLYQCINEKKKIILLSKSINKNKMKFLSNFKIVELFDEIHWLKETELKSDYIKERNSIFIDDSFSQRLEVERNNKIQSFSPSMIELLMDDRY